MISVWFVCMGNGDETGLANIGGYLLMAQSKQMPEIMRLVSWPSDFLQPEVANQKTSQGVSIPSSS